MHGVFILTTVGIQLFCLTCIAYVKWKYQAEENDQQNYNAWLRLNTKVPSNRVSPEEMQQPSVFVLRLRNTDAESLNNNEDQDAVVQGCISVPIINTAAYNKILTEVYHLAFIALVLALRLARQYVRTKLKTTSLVDWSRLLLCFLDTGPVILGSIGLPLLIHLSNPDIRSYIKRCFNNQ